MQERFYILLTSLTAILGPWIFVLVARGIAAGYFFGFPRRVATSVRFYRALFPGKSTGYHLYCTWRQFQNFTSVFFDRCRLQSSDAVPFTIKGREHLVQAVAQGSGGILLMTHMGNWEMGARLLRRNFPELRLMLYMGQQAKDQIERLQKEALATDGIRIVAVDRHGGSPFDLMEAIAFIRSGGFVSLAGDRVWRPGQRTVRARFLGHTIQLPEAPHMLALASGAPLFVFFAAREGARRYRFSIAPPFAVRATSRAQRRAAVRHSTQVYADRIEQQLRHSPFEWYHFESFLRPAARADEAKALPGI